MAELPKKFSKLTPEELSNLIEQYGSKKAAKAAYSSNRKQLKIKLEGETQPVQQEPGTVSQTGVSEGEYPEGTYFDPETGIAYETFTPDGKREQYKKIGNLPGHRYDGSVYKDIKLVDYEASIENYDPSKLSFVDKVKKDGTVKFKEYKPQRFDYDANTFRDESTIEEYAERGLTNGGKVTKARINGKLTEVETTENGLLKRLTVDKNGNYKATDSEYPKEIKSDSFSDLLESSDNARLQLIRDTQSVPTSSQSRRSSLVAAGKSKLTIN